jgi:hypothetical protein
MIDDIDGWNRIWKQPQMLFVLKVACVEAMGVAKVVTP